MHCIHVTYAFSLTLALELIWNVELVLACARFVQPIHMVRLPRIFKSGWLVNINKFINIAIEKDALHIHLIKLFWRR